jgi:hypothetical protein
MSFVVSSLSNYTNEQSKKMIAAVQFKAETAALAEIQTGVKSSAALQILSVDPIPQSGTSCGFNASGSTTFTQRTITTKAVKFEEIMCLRDLEAKWTQILLKNGQKYSEADVPSVIMDEITKKIMARLEVADWQGDTSSGSSYLNVYDGLLKIVDAANGVVSMTASTLNETNIRTILRDGVSKVPDALKGNSEFTFFCGYDTYTTYLNKISSDNHFHMFDASTYGEIRVENSPYKLKAVHGLDSTSRIIGMLTSNMVIGVDMEGEEEKAALWYSQDDDNVKYSFRFRRGWQIAIPSEVLEYTNA